MLIVSNIRANKDSYIQALKKRNFDATDIFDQILGIDENKRKLQHQLDEVRAESNKISKEIGILFKSGKREEAEAAKAKTGGLKDKEHNLKSEVETLDSDLTKLLYEVPNVPHDTVPTGLTENDNKVESEHGKIPTLHAGAKPHWDLVEDYKLIDFDLGSKVSGAGFPFYRGKGARLQRALINFFLDEATNAGYEEFISPHLVNEASGYGTGQLPDKEGQMYYVQEDDLYLIPTGEVPLTNIHRNTIVSDLPIKLCGHTPCFRREAGSYGKDVRGLNRLHQFDKVEIVQIQHPDKSYDTLKEMVAHVTRLLDKLELPYRILRLCGGDIGFTSALTFDLEVYSAAQERWLEVSSISNFESFQTNRLKCRFKNAEGKTELAHSLNGSALALPRILAALLENHQVEDGINIPAALHSYCGFDKISK